MSVGQVALLGGAIALYAVFSGQLRKSIITGPMLFLTFGVLVGPEGLDWLDFDLGNDAVEGIFEVTLALVLFVDASLDAPAPFTFTPLSGNDQQSIGSHQLHPEAVIQLCQTLYHSRPRAYLLAIRGYHFDHFGEALSEGAQRNLQAALDYIKRWINAHA